jgi:hypothetical protein
MFNKNTYNYCMHGLLCDTCGIYSLHIIFYNVSTYVITAVNVIPHVFITPI